MARYLVTGGAGFIGSNLVEALLGLGHDVRVIDDFSSGKRENLADTDAWSADGAAFDLIEGDIRDAETCRRAVDGMEFVLHKAAIPSVVRSVERPLDTNEVNVTGTLNLLQAARESGIRRFVFASSSSLYGESETLPKVESMPAAPVSPYGLQKLAGETYCLLYHKLYGLPTVALRYFNVFGQRQDPGSEYSAVIPRFVAAAFGQGRATIYGDGGQTRDFTHVDNVIEANLRACQAGDEACGKAYNIACGTRVSLNDLLKRIFELAGRPVEVDHLDPRPGDIRHSLAGIDRAVSGLGYAPLLSLDEGLQRLAGSV